MSILKTFIARIFSIPRVDTLPSPIDPKFINNTPAVYSAWGTEALFRDGFAGNASVYTIVSKAASKFGHIPWGVYKVENKEAYKKYLSITRQGLTTKQSRVNAQRYRKAAYNKTEQVNTLAALISRPNPTQGQDSFFEAAMVAYMTVGETFIWLNRGQVDDTLDDMQVMQLPIFEMYILPPQFMEVIPDRDDPWAVRGYYLDVYGNNTTRQFIRKCDVIHWKKTNPVFDPSTYRTHLRGLSPLKAGAKLLQQDDESTDAGVAMLQNGGAKAIIYNEDLKGTNPAQDTQLQEVMDRKVNNNKMKAAVAAIQGKWGMLDLGLSAVDMQLSELSKDVFVRLCNLLDVPPALFIVDQTYENKAASIKDWLTNSIIPKCCSLRDELNRSILLAFNIAGMIIDVDTSDIPELQEDLGKLVSWMNQFPWMTPNEKRVYLGEEEDPDPLMDKYYIPSNLVALEDLAMPDVTTTPEAQAQQDYNALINA